MSARGFMRILSILNVRRTWVPMEDLHFSSNYQEALRYDFIQDDRSDSMESEDYSLSNINLDFRQWG